jgi:DNA excision repair protein ERCC-4
LRGQSAIEKRLSVKRQELYRQGGLVSVTSRILVVDLLVGDLPTSLIDGMVVMHAEK